jgi:hypothetical protein
MTQGGDAVVRGQGLAPDAINADSAATPTPGAYGLPAPAGAGQSPDPGC